MRILVAPFPIVCPASNTNNFSRVNPLRMTNLVSKEEACSSSSRMI